MGKHPPGASPTNSSCSAGNDQENRSSLDFYTGIFGLEKTRIMEIVNQGMEELKKMATAGDPLWVRSFLSPLSEYEYSFWILWLQLKKYYQPRKSNRITLVNIEGTKVPLYGAGSSLAASNNGAVQVPLTLQFDIHSRGNVVGKLVRTKHRVQISCPVVIDSSSTKPMKFKKDSCFYNWFVWCICRLFEIGYGIW